MDAQKVPWECTKSTMEMHKKYHLIGFLISTLISRTGVGWCRPVSLLFFLLINQRENMKNQPACKNCFYQKVKDTDPDTGELTWGHGV